MSWSPGSRGGTGWTRRRNRKGAEQEKPKTAADQRVATCEVHDRALFGSRKAAKRMLSRWRPGSGMRAYPCDAVEGMWHVGHLPQKVIRGEIGRDQIGGKEV